ncbi:MAG: DUF362 domain-containing protein [Treponemataceae bacterium]|nr:DUF362 domain-containing protein [Treponemataceae bacterium]
MQLKKKLLALCAVLIVLGGSCAFGAGKKAGAAAELLPHQTADERAPVVYFVRAVTGDALVKVYDALGWSPKGKTGVKISTGEPPASNYLRPALIAAVVKKVNGTIVESNTAYGGSRSSVALHKQVVKDHGFLDIAAFDLQDEDGVMTIPVNGKRLDVDYVGSHFKDYGSYLVLSHFKGHLMAGFGGAIKNLSIGFASGTSADASGKIYIHSGGLRTKGSFMGEQIPFLESMAEAAQGVCRAMDGGKNIAFVNVLNRLSVDCDCDGHPSEPDMHDIGILASLDPLAIDQASVDLVYAAPDSASLRTRIESRQGLHTLDYAAEIGLGSRAYRLVELR